VTTQANAKQTDSLVDEQQVIDFLIANPDFFLKNTYLLADMDIRHETGSAVSLIERQISLLRERNAHFENKLNEMVDAVHDNQRLNTSLQRLAINLFMVDGLDDIIATIDDEIRNNLSTDFFSIRLITEDESLVEQQPERYLHIDDEGLEDLRITIDEKRIQCGRFTTEQAKLFFEKDFEKLGSGAVVPVADAETYGLIGLGSHDEQHYHPGMGVDFLQQLSSLISASIKPHLKK
jgi:uncharacterized protein